MQKITTIYCLKDPTDKNRVFYVGKTVSSLSTRLRGHINSPSGRYSKMIIGRILKAGKKPTIHLLELCYGPHTHVGREMFWIREFNKKKRKLANMSRVPKAIRTLQ